MTDHLAKIAAWTVPFGTHGTTQLDPRFTKLRNKLLHVQPCSCNCVSLGYTVNEDLTGLLEIAAKEFYHVGLYYTNEPESDHWRCAISDPLQSINRDANTPLEAAAKAVWEWLVAQEEVGTDA